MKKIVFSIVLLALLLFQTGCTKHNKCDCIKESINLSGVYIAYDDPLIFGAVGQYKIYALILPGNPSQEEIEKALNREINPYNGNPCYLIVDVRNKFKKYNLQSVNVALSWNYHNCFDEPETYNILCIEKE
jgi:hypothetical protein